MVYDGAEDRVECQCDRTAEQAMLQVIQHHYTYNQTSLGSIIISQTTCLPRGISLLNFKLSERYDQSWVMIHKMQTFF